MLVKELLEGEVIKGNFGKKPEKEPVRKELTVLQAFGSKEQNILHDAGIHLMEKPDYFESLEKDEGKYKPISQIIFKKVEKELAKNGFVLAVLKASDVYGADPRGPQVKFKKKPAQDMYVLEMSDGKRYLCDQSASTYCRMWALIK